MRTPLAFVLAVFPIVALANPKIALNVDGQANYSFLAPWANIAGQFDPTTNITYWTGYVAGDYKVTWSGAGAPGISGAKCSFQVTGAGRGVLRLHHDKPGRNGGGRVEPGPHGTADLTDPEPA